MTALLDACPGCVLSTGNTELPTRVTDEPDRLVAHYECHDCGTAWSSPWLKAV